MEGDGQAGRGSPPPLPGALYVTHAELRLNKSPGLGKVRG